MQFPKRRVARVSGNMRMYVAFAWLPTEVKEDVTVWLESYLVFQIWYNDGDEFKVGGTPIKAMGDGWRTMHCFAQQKD